MALTGRQAISNRIKKAKNVWGALRRKLFNHSKIATRAKALLWNALIRSTLTYAIQTQDISQHGQRNVNGFTFKCTRQILHRYWYNETHKPQGKKRNASTTYHNIMDQQTTNHAHAATDTRRMEHTPYRTSIRTKHH